MKLNIGRAKLGVVVISIDTEFVRYSLSAIKELPHLPPSPSAQL
ncbi:hypothetical protein [Amycolatopsis sp. lyj-23]